MEQKNTAKIDRKRKFLWDVIVQPLKTRRVDREERRPLEVTRGHFSLKDIRGAKFPGCQTSATSLCAILQTRTLSPSSWSVEVIDKLLLQGDKLHSTRVVRLGKQKTDHTDLTPEELPKKVAVKHEEYTLEYKKVVQNLTCRENLSHKRKVRSCIHRAKQMRKILKQCLGQNHGGILLKTKKETMALMSDSTYCYLFHPCKQSTTVLSTNEYEAVLCKFRDVGHLSIYLCDKFIRDETDIALNMVDISVKFDVWTEFSLSRKLSWV